MNRRANIIINKLKEKYKNIDTILVFGSALTDDWNPILSDVDVFFIDKSLDDKRIEEEIDGIKVEILTDNFDDLAKNIESERGKLLNRNLSNMIHVSEIIVSKSAEKLVKIKKLADEVILSETYFDDDDVRMWKYSIEDYLSKAAKDVAKNDCLAFYLDAHFVIQNLLELTLATHGKFFIQPKNMRQILTEIQPELVAKLEEYIQANSEKNKLASLKEIAKFAV